jgi:hypothetical protein
MKNCSVPDFLGQEITVGDICLAAFVLNGEFSNTNTLKPVVITKISLHIECDDTIKFLVNFVDRQDRLEDWSASHNGKMISLFKIDNPEFYLQNIEFANLIPIRQDAIKGNSFQVRLPIF